MDSASANRVNTANETSGQNGPDSISEADISLPSRKNSHELGFQDNEQAMVPERHILYELDYIPPWYETIAMGFQLFLSAFGGVISATIIVGVRMCMSHDTEIMSQLICTAFLVCGIGTILQSTLGCRLAIIQGQGAFFVAVYAILDYKGPCPVIPSENATQVELDTINAEWRSRILEIQGGILVGSCFQLAVGFTGCIGILLKYIGPLTITPIVTLLGLALIVPAVDLSGGHWGIAGLTIALIILISQLLAPYDIPIPKFNREKKCHIGRMPIFKLFPVIIAITLVWILCAILTAANVFPDDSSNPNYNARTDIKLDALKSSPWFRVPYPGQWGRPIVTVGGVFGIVAGVIVSILDSVGDYYACARISEAAKPPHHAINRGIFMEGIGCIVAGAWGTGLGMASYSECIGIIGITRVAGRVIAQVAGIIFILVAIFAKVGVLLATIPYPIIGGTIFVGAALVMGVGLSNLQFVNLNSTRNLLVLGTSICGGFGIPVWLSWYPGAIHTGSAEADSVLAILLTNDLCVGGIIGFILDNILPGTYEERGMSKWLVEFEENDTTVGTLRSYDLPLGMDFIRRSQIGRYIPMSPTFQGFSWQIKTLPQSTQNTGVAEGGDAQTSQLGN